ncbi:uncharacterized protein LOC111700167 [Eurytemora carolleeae]|uniref:uncharacterized protein LOC111700167 n=1 Tax=Eurytemora carolleeae TaxID=1294199 RepID=UPI000C7563CF|nr:uncharacterized protein LOC111700167 [Eurytemora carolleeae]|eukprot:XP_023326765.1 uncharacterized protein LOC111700167 [Eurytemora affinis]
MSEYVEHEKIEGRFLDGGSGGGGGTVVGGYGGGGSGYGGYGGGGYGGGCDGYGCQGGGGGGPVYVYQQTTAGGGGLGVLAALLPLAALIPLALLALPVTVTLTGGKKRKRRSEFGIPVSNLTGEEDWRQDTRRTEPNLNKDASILHSFLQAQELNHSDLHKDLVARYLECGEETNLKSNELLGCLERLSCLVYDTSTSTKISKLEKQVANILLRTVLENELLTPGLKNQILAAGQVGYSQPGSCTRFKCRNSLISRRRSEEDKRLSVQKNKKFFLPASNLELIDD